MRFTNAAYQAYKDSVGEKPLETPKPELKNEKLPEAGDVTEPEQPKDIKRDTNQVNEDQVKVPDLEGGIEDGVE